MERLHCLKCGDTVKEGAAFCETCLKSMENYPVPQDTVLVLPKREDNGLRRNYGRKRNQSTEELLAEARQRIKKLRVLICFLILISILLTVGCVFLLRKENAPALGQNYSTVSTSATTGSLPMED